MTRGARRWVQADHDDRQPSPHHDRGGDVTGRIARRRRGGIEARYVRAVAVDQSVRRQEDHELHDERGDQEERLPPAAGDEEGHTHHQYDGDHWDGVGDERPARRQVIQPRRAVVHEPLTHAVVPAAQAMVEYDVDEQRTESDEHHGQRHVSGEQRRMRRRWPGGDGPGVARSEPVAPGARPRRPTRPPGPPLSVLRSLLSASPTIWVNAWFETTPTRLTAGGIGKHWVNQPGGDGCWSSVPWWWPDS